tara:strand:+ start:20476 stop:21858 length:1383 start_codon:yes stop_codon:yes gene_type:complete
MKELKLDNNNFVLSNLRKRIELITKEEQIVKWDLGASIITDLSVQVDHGEAKQLKGSQKTAITIRVWNNEGLVGITSTSDLSDKGLRKALRLAFQSSVYGNKNESPDFSPLSTSPLPEISNELKESVGMNNLLQILRNAEAKLLKSHKYINSVPYNGLSEVYIKRIYLNSKGATREMEVTQASIYLYAKAEEEGKKPRSSGSVKVSNGIDTLDINGCIEQCSVKTISHIAYKPIRTNKYLICFTPEAFLDLVGAFSNMFNARSILDGVSLSNKDTIGKKIAVPFLSISDQPLHSENIGCFSFDGEGTPKKNISLISNGKLINLLHSQSTANAFGVEPTGHAGLGAKASVSHDWFVIEKAKGEQCYKQTLNHKNTKEEYVLVEGLNALHAGVKASQGSFSLPFDGWLVNNGNKVSIEAATIAGDIKDVLNSILNIEDDLFITHQGVSPHIWIDNISITGEA